MHSSDSDVTLRNRQLPSEEKFRARLINRMVVMGAVASCFTFAFTQVRALEIGWSLRDGIQLAIVACIVITAFFREQVPTHFKAVLLVLVCLAIGMVGLYTLGMLAGGIFFFPLAAVIMALFYSERAVAVFVFMSMIFLVYIAASFTSGQISLTPSGEQLITSNIHWVVYIGCMGLFFLITCVTILSYRRAMGHLVAEINRHRHELDKSNQDLLHALSKVKMLSGLLSICASCKKIRDDDGNWNQLDLLIKNRPEPNFSHNICPDCAKELYPEFINRDGTV